MSLNPADATVRLSDLRRAQPAHATLENVLETLVGQIRTCSRLAVFEYEAGSEGFPACADAFRQLADSERQSFNSLLDCLREHLDDMRITTDGGPVAAPEEGRS